MESILKRDNQSLDEIIIWKDLIRWGLAQHPFIPKDVKEWSEEDISNIEKTLHSHIQLINFYAISSEDFFYKVLPHKKLLPKKRNTISRNFIWFQVRN